ncbi:MAG: hypothetical protein IPK13_00655 [Deltaproteobacteria bacterium]|nr:hypothetical protein [Deltaproteobacteria bacterium]
MNNEAAATTSAAADATEPEEDGALVFTGQLFRKRRGRRFVFTEEAPAPPEPPPEPVRRPARVAQMLAFAHGLNAAIDRGDFRDQADAARHFQLTRARITQLMNLTHLAPDIQEQVLFLEAVDGREPMSERDLRTVIGAGDWGAQRALWLLGTWSHRSS